MIRNFNFKIDWLFWFLILLPTFYIFNQVDIRQSQTNFYQVAIILLVAFLHVNKFLGLFLAWAVIQFVFFNHELTSAYQLNNLFLGCLLYQFIVLFSKTDNFKKYLWALSGLLIFNVLWIPLQMFNVDPVWNIVNFDKQQVMTEFQGWFCLPAFFGNYAAAIAPLIVSLCWPLSIFSVIALFFSKSTFSVIAALVAVLFFFYFKKRIVFWVLLVLSLACGGFYIAQDLPGGQFSRRLVAWEVATKQAFRNQFFGNGLGSLGQYYKLAEVTPTHNAKLTKNTAEFLQFVHDEAAKKGKTEIVDYVKTFNPSSNIDGGKFTRELQKHEWDVMFWDDLHNEFLQVFFELGLFGLFFLMAYLFDLFKRFFRFAKNNVIALTLASSVVAISIVSLGHFPFHLARLAGPFITILALLDAHLIEIEGKSLQEV